MGTKYGVGKNLRLLKSRLDFAKGCLGSNPPDLTGAEGHVDEGSLALLDAHKAYEAYVNKCRAAYKKAKAKIVKMKEVIDKYAAGKIPDPGEAIDWLQQAIKDYAVAEKENKKD